MPQLKAPKPRTLIKYEVIYTPKEYEDIAELMSKLDLGITGMSAPCRYIWSWTTTAKVDQAYRQRMRRAIIKALKAQGIKQIVSIKKV